MKRDILDVPYTETQVKLFRYLYRVIPASISIVMLIVYAVILFSFNEDTHGGYYFMSWVIWMALHLSVWFALPNAIATTTFVDRANPAFKYTAPFAAHNANIATGQETVDALEKLKQPEKANMRVYFKLALTQRNHLYNYELTLLDKYEPDVDLSSAIDKFINT